MNNVVKVNVLIVAFFIVTAVAAQDEGIATKEWLDLNRPSMAAQLCDDARSPFRATFSGTSDECEAEVGRIFDYCATEVPNIRLPETLTDLEGARSAAIALYDCVIAVHLGGRKLEDFRRKYPLESQITVRGAND